MAPPNMTKSAPHGTMGSCGAMRWGRHWHAHGERGQIRGCCQQRLGSPRQSPLKESAKILVINDGVVPEMQL